MTILSQLFKNSIFKKADSRCLVEPQQIRLWEEFVRGRGEIKGSAWQENGYGGLDNTALEKKGK